MRQRIWPGGMALAALLLAGAWAVSALGGCTPQQYEWWKRQRSYPPDYKNMPLGEEYTTADDVARLKDASLRSWMQDWLAIRKEYLKTWREKGDYDAQVKRLQNRRAMLKAAIQDRATQLGIAGQPLS